MTKKYKLKNTNLYHNGKFVAVGSIIELNENDAKKLSDVLVEVKEKTNAQTNTSKTATEINTKVQGQLTRLSMMLDIINQYFILPDIKNIVNRIREYFCDIIFSLNRI